MNKKVHKLKSWMARAWPNVAQSPQSKRRKTVWSLALAAKLLLISVVMVLAVHGDFELEGNITSDGSTDWAELFNADGSPKALPPDGIASQFTADDVTFKGQKDGTVFTESAKNNDAVSSWSGGETSQITPKDELSNVYSYFKVAGNDLLVYAGLERVEPGGDSHVGVELNQDTIEFDPDTGSFSGAKTVDDLLLIMNFEQGGAIGIVELRKWNGNEWVELGTEVGEGCLPNDIFCAFNNGGDIDGGPWKNLNDKGNEIEFLPENAFTEMGVNVGQTVGNKCFKTVQFHSRSSASFNSELKDFVEPQHVSLCVGPEISVSPEQATNQVSKDDVDNSHEFTVMVQGERVDGTTNAPVSGVEVTASIDSGPGVFVGSDKCTTDGTGTCTITIDSTEPGVSTVSFAATIDGEPLTPAIATKTWVDARITFLQQSDGSQVGPEGFGIIAFLETNDGSGWQPAGGETITFAIKDGPGDFVDDGVDSDGDGINGNDCVTDGSGTCTVTLINDTDPPQTGLTTVEANFNGTVAQITVDITEETTVRWVSAELDLTPETATNVLGVPHLLEATLALDDGDGDPTNEPGLSGRPIVFSIGQGEPGSFQNPDGGSCIINEEDNTATCTTNDSGLASVELINDNTIGVTNITADWDDGTTLNSIPVSASAAATKSWIVVQLVLTPDTAANQIGDSHNITGKLQFDNGGGFVDVQSATGSIDFTTDLGNLSSASCDIPLDGNGCAVTLDNLDTPGLSSISATWNGGDIVIPSVTDPVTVPAKDATAVKRWVDATLDLDIPDSTVVVAVGTEVDFMATLAFDDGDPSNDPDDPSGQIITFAIESGSGTFVGGDNTCTTGEDGVPDSCSVAVVSDAPGPTEVSAALIDGPFTTNEGVALVSVGVAPDPLITATKTWGTGAATIGTVFDCVDPFETLGGGTNNDLTDTASPIIFDANGDFAGHACVSAEEEFDVYQIDLSNPATFSPAIFTVSVSNLETDLDVVAFFAIPLSEEVFEASASEVDSTGRSTSGRSTTGRSTSGRSTSGRSTSGRSTSGRSTSGRSTSAVVGGAYSVGLDNETASFVAPEPDIYYILVYRPGEVAVQDGPYDIAVHLEGIDIGSCGYNAPGPGVPGTVYPLALPSNPTTLILTHQERMGEIYGVADAQALTLKLQALADAVDGIVVPVETDTDVVNAYSAWNTDYCSVQAANNVTDAIRDLILSYTTQFPSIEYVVIAGSDELIPHRRDPDETPFGNEREYALDLRANPVTSPIFWSVTQGYVLTDDFFVSENPPTAPYGGHKLYIRDWDIGRLVETPTQMMTTIDRFLGTIPGSAGGRVEVGSCLVTSYDFLLDSGQQIASELSSFGITTVTELNNDVWDAEDLFNAWTLATPVHNLVSVNAHFEHDLAIPASLAGGFFENTFISDFDGYADTVAYSEGCHAGLNLPNSGVDTTGFPESTPDLTEAIMGQGAAAWVANTGYGFGMDDTIADSEKLMVQFTEEMGEEHDVPVGQALSDAKLRFIDDTGANAFGVFEHKSMIEATTYGLPMTLVDVPDPQPIADGPTPLLDKTFGLAALAPGDSDIKSCGGPPGTVCVDLDPQLRSSDEGRWYELDGETTVRHGEPVQPFGRIEPNLPNNCTPRGLLLDSASYFTEGPWDPVIATASDVFKRPEPSFGLNGRWPSEFWGLSPIETEVTFTAGQFNPDGLFQNTFTNITFDVACDAEANDYGSITILNPLQSSVDGSNVEVSVNVETDGDGNVVEEVRVTCDLPNGDGTGGSFQSFALTQDGADPFLWTGSLPLPVGTECLVQARDSKGHVAIDSNRGMYYALGVPNADNVNSIGTSHTVVLELKVNIGGGFIPAENGTTLQPASLDGVGFILFDYCTDPGTEDGECDIVITSNEPGISTVTVPLSGSTLPFPVEGDFTFTKEWYAGSISLFKTIEPSSSQEICFTLSKADGGAVSLISDATPATQCATSSHLFQWQELKAGEYKLVETVPANYTPIEPVTDIVIRDDARDVLVRTYSNHPSEGCSPGYWKNHIDQWPGDPSALFADVFEVELPGFEGLTLLEVVNLGGGDFAALGRHGVSGLLAAISGDVVYPRSPQRVIELIQEAIEVHDSDPDRFNEILSFFAGLSSATCPLN